MRSQHIYAHSRSTAGSSAKFGSYPLRSTVADTVLLTIQAVKKQKRHLIDLVETACLSRLDGFSATVSAKVLVCALDEKCGVGISKVK